MARWVDSFIKTHQKLHFIRMLFTVCKIVWIYLLFHILIQMVHQYDNLQDLLKMGNSVIFTSKWQVLSMEKKPTPFWSHEYSSDSICCSDWNFNRLQTNSYRRSWAPSADSFTRSSINCGAISTTLLHHLRLRWLQVYLKFLFQGGRLNKWYENFKSD